MKSVWLIIWIVWMPFATKAGAIEQLQKKIDLEQLRIDMLDGMADGKITLQTPDASERAFRIYFLETDQLQTLIEHSDNALARKNDQLQLVLDQLQQVSEANYMNFSFLGRMNRLRLSGFENNNKRTEALIMADLLAASASIPFFLQLPEAQNLVLNISRAEPGRMMRYFRYVAYEPWAAEVFQVLLEQDPMRLKDYLSAENHLTAQLRKHSSPEAEGVRNIFQRFGTQTRAYLLLQSVVKDKVSLDEAHRVASDPEKLFRKLIALRSGSAVVAAKSIDDELEWMSLRFVREVNDLHDLPDEQRFVSLKGFSSAELYTLICYSKEEVFTSSFLYMFRQMMARMPEKSAYEFLFHLGFNRFRQWLALCAGYNTLEVFFNRMSPTEKQLLFDRLIRVPEGQAALLQEAASLADIYSSLSQTGDKLLFSDKLSQVRREIGSDQTELQLMYDLLIEMVAQDQIGSKPAWIEQHATIPTDRLFQNGVHIQQHFFYDDPDGLGSYNTFIECFDHPGWKLKDWGNYVCVESVSGKKVKMYANKPKMESEGQKDLHELFKKEQRWPDMVVHRGHSYYARIAIETVTPGTQVVFLGSCGGYHVVHEVLERSPESAIISSKQIGTHRVNNTLIWEMAETIRQGKDLNWQILWKKTATTADTEAKKYFEAYVRPDQNLGAMLIQAYLQQLEWVN